MTATEVMVVDVSFDAVTMKVHGESKRIAWLALRQAAKQDDTDLAGVYSALLADAERMARGRKTVRVAVHNMSGGDDDLGARTWAATLHYMSGEFATGRLVAADWGQTGNRAYALRDADEARTTLAARGYEVA